MTPYRISPAADADLDDRASHLAREASIETALRFYDAAAATFEAIGRTPGIGKPRESPDPRLSDMRVRRIDGFENHLVF